MKSSLSMAGQMIVYHIIMMVISMLFLWMLGDQYWIQAVLSVLLLVGYGYVLFADGGMRGEKAATMTAAIERQKEEGRAVDPSMIADSYKPKAAWIGYALGVLPVLLVAVVNLAVEPLYPAYQPMTDEEYAAFEQQMLEAQTQQQAAMQMPLLEGEVEEAAETPVPTEAAAEAQVEEALQDAEAKLADAEAQVEQAEAEVTETAAEEAGPVNWMSVVARCVFSPYVAAYKPLSYQPHVLYLLFVVFALAIPVCEPIGYLQGPKLRKKKLEAIAKGSKKKRKNLKVNRKPKERKGPKMEV